MKQSKGKVFDKVLIVMFENQYRNYVMQDVFMRKLATAGASMNYFFGAFHPSQTNYIASLAGEVCAVTNDTPPATLMQRTLVDLMEEARVSWKAYMEGYPGDPWNPEWQNPEYPSDMQPLNESPDDKKNLARYFRKHNAFASFHTIQASEERWSKIVGDHQFWKDVESKALPEYSWFTPDIWNDGHYLYNTHVDTNPRTQLIPQISGWLEYVFFADIESKKVQGSPEKGPKSLGLNLDIDLLLTDPEKAWANSNVPKGTLIVVTFDEADFDAIGYDTSYEGPNQVYTVLLGDMIQAGTNIDVPYNHYSLIKTIEKNYALGDLGKNDATANWFRFLWKEQFSWGAPQKTGLSGGKDLALTAFKGNWYIASLNPDGYISFAEYSGDSWSVIQETSFYSQGPIALTTYNDRLHLVFTDQDRYLYTTSSADPFSWAEPEPLGFQTAGDITMTSYYDEADHLSKMMLCWVDEQGFIKYLIYKDTNGQETSGEVGQLTDGPMAIGQLGGSLFLVYKERNTKGMRLTSFNLAPYNAFKAQTFEGDPAPENNTSLHQWSPADMLVGNFAKKLNALQNNYTSLGKMAMANIEGELHLMHRGAFQDSPNAYTEYYGLTGIFTAENQLTNGYGTIDQAGWTEEQELSTIQLDPDSPIAMASDGQTLMVVWQESENDQLSFLAGSYKKV